MVTSSLRSTGKNVFAGRGGCTTMSLASSCFIFCRSLDSQLEPAISEWPRRLRDTRDKPGLAETSDPYTKRKEDDLSPDLAIFLTKKGFKLKLILRNLRQILPYKPCRCHDLVAAYSQVCPKSTP